MIVAEGYAYELFENVRDGFKEDVFLERYSDILLKYDYIVGDWGYGQLRLKGFSHCEAGPLVRSSYHADEQANAAAKERILKES